MITKYSNTPISELLRIAEDTENELAIEVGMKAGVDEERNEEIYEEGYEDGYIDGRMQGYDACNSDYPLALPK